MLGIFNSNNIMWGYPKRKKNLPTEKVHVYFMNGNSRNDLEKNEVAKCEIRTCKLHIFNWIAIDNVL